MSTATPNKPDYSYQKDLEDRAYASLLTGTHTVLAATPGAGKTRMALNIVNRFLEKNKEGRVLILTHGQILLRDQWKELVERQFHSHAIVKRKNNAQYHFETKSLILALPQTLHKAKLGKVNLLIVDEAHQRFLAKQVQTIIQETSPDYILLLTGTPSVFINNPKYNVIGITVEELLDYNVLCDPLIEIVQSDYNYSYEDFDKSTLTLKESKFDHSHTRKTLDNLLPQIVKKLSSQNRDNPELFKWDESSVNWNGILKDLAKTMIVCNNQRQAKEVSDYFNSNGIKAVLSISEINDGTKELEEFKSDDSVLVFVVVHRGSLGFNFEKLINLIDLSGSLNANRIFQALCRTVRKHPEKDIKKIFIKTTNKEMAEVTFFVMSFVVALSTKKFYYSYNTSYQLDKAMVPVPKEFSNALLDKKKKKNIGKNKEEAELAFPDLPKLLTFTKLKDFNNNNLKVGTIAYTNFTEVIRSVSLSGGYNFTDEEIIKEARKFKTRKMFSIKRPTYYNFAFRHNKQHILDEIYGPLFRWTEELIIKKAIECGSYTDFRRLHRGAYNAAKRAGILDKVCEASSQTTRNKVYINSDNRLKSIAKDYEILEDGTLLFKGKPAAVYATKSNRKSRKYYYIYKQDPKEPKARTMSARRSRYAHLLAKYRGEKSEAEKRIIYDSRNRVKISASRMAYYLFFKELSPSDNVSFVDEDLALPHLLQKKNLYLSPKGRSTTNKQEVRRRHNYKLRIEEIEKIRAAHRAGATQVSLAKEYKVSKSTVSYIINGKTWA